MNTSVLVPVPLRHRMAGEATSVPRGKTPILPGWLTAALTLPLSSAGAYALGNQSATLSGQALLCVLLVTGLPCLCALAVHLPGIVNSWADARVKIIAHRDPGNAAAHAQLFRASVGATAMARNKIEGQQVVSIANHPVGSPAQPQETGSPPTLDDLSVTPLRPAGTDG
ncbi:hypothetical protein [Nonomuraea sp. NPDC003754]